MAEYPSSERSRIRRLPARGTHSRDVVDGILDAALVCHVGFVVGGRPVVIPTIHARRDGTLYLHGSAASRMLRTIRDGAEVCVTATIVDGIVLARSLFNHSMNYRSVVAFGTGRRVTDPEERTLAFEAITERLVPGRWEDARRPDAREDRATAIVAVEIEEASAKVRRGPPGDDEADRSLPHWAGVLPIELRRGRPVPAPDLAEDVGLPAYLHALADPPD